MAPLTSRVLDSALAQRRAWADRGRELIVAVNVSPSNLVDEHFPDELAGLLTRHGVPASALVLEVSESLLMADRERSVRVLAGLREAGVGVSIDDYGTGYSSLAYLATLPVTELKLDRTFVGGMTGSARSASIVTSTLQLAHALGWRSSPRAPRTRRPSTRWPPWAATSSRGTTSAARCRRTSWSSGWTSTSRQPWRSFPEFEERGAGGSPDEGSWGLSPRRGRLLAAVSSGG
jgi:predicted signal transduction protein with EAL and GGDEF domain